MATSTVTLYYASSSAEWELIPTRLLKVENIADYLALKTKTTLSNFQYIKPELEIAITCDLSQIYASPLMPSYKYVGIHNSDDTTGKIYYYFVKKAVWRSKTTVRFELVMDVLNTFTEGSDYTFKANTKITREHKDRFKLGIPEISLRLSHPSLTGVLNVGDTITFKYEDQDLGWQDICEGEITFIDLVEEEIYFICTDGTPVEDIGADIDNHIYDYFSVTKDNLNYCEFNIYDYDIDRSCFRVIDPIPEGINPALQCGSSNGVLVENPKSLLAQNWYLLYRNVNDPDPSSYVNPVDCFLIPENEIKVNAGSVTAGRLPYLALNLNRYYWLRFNGGSSVSITLDDGTTITAPALATDLKYIIFYRNSNNRIVLQTVKGSFNGYVDEVKTYETSYITLNDLPQAYVYTSSVTSGGAMSDYTTEYNNGTSGTWTDEVVTSVLSAVSDLDRTEAKHIKLIKLPYCPYDFVVNNDTLDISLDNNWSYESITQGGQTFYALKLNDLNIKLNSTFRRTENEISPLYRLQYNAPKLTHTLNDLRKGASYESKLFHSEFYRPTYVYDSFTFVMQLEKLYLDSYFNVSERALNLKFTMTSTINSKFMFTFTNYYLDKADENYAKYLIVERNNEEVLYNVPYLNYVRSGYNYDTKNKNIQNMSNLVGLGASGGALAISMAMPSASLKIAGVIGAIVSFAMTAKNALVSAVNGENSIRQKLDQTKNQAATVEGSNDVDLMSEYSGNRIKFLEYNPSNLMTNLLYNLFFYGGYNSGRMGLPNHNTRINFDYLECDASIEKLANIPDDILNELVNCFKNGVTYLHKTTRAGLAAWDFEQKYENYEKWFFE